jgi:hypothetical protein
MSLNHLPQIALSVVVVPPGSFRLFPGKVINFHYKTAEKDFTPIAEFFMLHLPESTHETINLGVALKSDGRCGTKRLRLFG